MKVRSLQTGLLVRLILIKFTVMSAFLLWMAGNQEVGIEFSLGSLYASAEEAVDPVARTIRPELLVLPEPDRPFYAAAFTADGQVLSGSDDEMVRFGRFPGVNQGIIAVLREGEPMTVQVFEVGPDAECCLVYVMHPPDQRLLTRIGGGIVIMVIVLLLTAVAGGFALLWSVKAVLRPVNRLAESMGNIDVSRLDTRLCEETAPREVRPFVAAVNNALDRLAAGFAAQRQFMADAAHELRTPVTILALRIGTSPDSRVRRLLERDVESLRIRVEQLLAVARMERPQAPLPVALAPDVVARDIIADMAPLADRTGVHLALDVEPMPARVLADADGLRSILGNLLDNALKFSPPGGTVTVRVERQGRITVSDEGPGIPPEALEAVFAPFKRLDTARPGLGLGLSIARRAAEAMGGRLTAVAPSRGGRFVLELPTA